MVEKASPSSITVSSSAFKYGEIIPKKYSGQGADVSPPLSWTPGPAETKSYALINDDPDAPVGNWVHWLVKNIPPEITFFAENSFSGIAAPNSWGNSKYGGPMPPKGKAHRYFYKIYALNVSSLKATTDSEFYAEVEKHKIAEGSLMGTYKKT